MKARVIFEFELENEQGVPINNEGPVLNAADDAVNAIETRLLGEGFLPDDVMISWQIVKAEVVVS